MSGVGYSWHAISFPVQSGHESFQREDGVAAAAGEGGGAAAHLPEQDPAAERTPSPTREERTRTESRSQTCST